MWSAVKGAIFHDWQIITGGMNRGHTSQSLAVSNLMYVVRNMQQCTLECGIWDEFAHYTKEKSQHCHVMISNSK